ncbi:hypothetical protein JZ785_20255 [Alicyclobacillus curvatus]|nr:hypothetical protein JZ785_20255 [Alicyclobacillus curvatus]
MMQCVKDIGGTFADNGQSVWDISTTGLGAPGNVQVKGTTVSWNPVQGATGYWVSLASTTSQAYFSVNTVTTALDMSLEGIPSGTYTVVVGAYNNQGANSPGTSAANNLQIQSQGTLATPGAITQTGTVLSWDPVPHATGYFFNLTDGSNITTTFPITSPSVALSSPDYQWLGAGTYDFTVQATGVGTNFANSNLSAKQSVTLTALAQPTLTSVKGTTVSWNAVTNATSYMVTVYDATTGKQVSGFSTSDTSADLAKQGLQSGSYFVTVTAQDGSGAYRNSPESTSTKTQFGASGVIAITSNGALQSPTISQSGLQVSWSAVPNATEYTVAIQGTGSASWVNWTMSSSTPGFDLGSVGLASGTYNITVTAGAPDSNYTQSPASNRVAVIVTGPATPNPTLSGSTLSWQPVSGATSYQVQIDELNGNYVKNFSYQASVTSVDLSKLGLPSGEFVAQVTAGESTPGSAGNASSYMSSQPSPYTQEFTVASAGVLSPAANVKVVGSTVSWNAVQGVTDYTVDIFRGGQLYWEISPIAWSSYDLSPLGLTSGTTYGVTVKALGAGTQYTDSQPSAAVSFTAQ